MSTVAFLQQFHPEGFWALTAIQVDRKGIETRTFTPAEADLARAWINERDGKVNLYFNVNQSIAPKNKKAKQEDIAAVGWFHVDIDAQPGVKLDDELKRIRDLLDNCPVVRPTVAVYSGGGYQAFWKLREPIPINGDLIVAEETALYNKQIELLLGGDNCHNIDRIMRLPGTMNIPNAKKAERGRYPVRSEVCWFETDRVYDRSQFTRAEPSRPQSAPDAPVEARRVEINELDEWHVEERVKIIIAQGHDPDKPKPGDSSRSAWLYDVICHLVRAGVPDEVTFGVITDPKFDISASVIDKGANADSYARRQILRARGEDDPVAWVNARYFSVLEGGKVTYYREEDDGSVEGMQSQAFDFELEPHRTDDKSKTPYAKLWRLSPRRRYYPRGFVLNPKPAPAGYYNLWRDFAVKPKPGDWGRIWAHVHDVLASGNKDHADYILKWVAWSLQNPHRPPRVALVFRSDEEGIGKGVFGNALVRLFGTHGLRIQDIGHLTGRFNAHLRHCCLLFVDEASVTENDGVLRGYITEPTVPSEKKGQDTVKAVNHLHIVMASNSKWVVPAGKTARRYAVFEVSAQRKGDRDYFHDLFTETEGPGLGAMLYDMLTWDLRNWHPETNRPDTAALNQQKSHSLPPVEKAWLECLCSGVPPSGATRQKAGLKLPTLVMRDHVRELYPRSDISFNVVADLFKKLGYKQHNTSRPRAYVVPSLGEAREGWDKLMFEWEWMTPGDPRMFPGGDMEDWVLPTPPKGSSGRSPSGHNLPTDTKTEPEEA